MTWDFCTSLYLSPSYITLAFPIVVYLHPLFVSFLCKTLAYKCLAPTAARTWTARRTDTTRRRARYSHDPRCFDGGAASQERRFGGSRRCSAWQGARSTSESSRSMERFREQTVESRIEVLEPRGE
jgi:hypothetical protein